MAQSPDSSRTIAILAFTQVLSWGSLNYAFSILAPAIQNEMGWRAEIVFGAFSWALLVAGVAATPIGLTLDRFGGKLVMGFGSMVCGIGLILLSQAHTVPAYFGAWSVLGLAMALTLYEAAFATIHQQFVVNARRLISMVTLFGGFASTVFWPSTLKLDGMLGWRDTYWWYGVAQLTLCLPLHLMLGNAEQRRTDAAVSRSAPRSHTLSEAVRHPAFWKLALAFCANSFVFSALSVYLIPLLKQLGHAATLAVFMAALIGPMQVAGRLGEMTVARHALPHTVGKFAFSTLPAALLALLLFGIQHWAVAVFCILYGLGNGILTILRGTIPQALFGRKNYGAISGALAGPSLLSKAAGPLAVAAIAHTAPTPYPVLGILLLLAVASLGFYLSAVKISVAGSPASAESA